MLDISTVSDYNSSATMKCNSLTPEAIQRACFVNELVGMSRMSGRVVCGFFKPCILTDFLSYKEVYEKTVYCSMWNKIQAIIRAGKGSVLSWIDSCISVVFGESEISVTFQPKTEDKKWVCISSNSFDYGYYYNSWAFDDCSTARSVAFEMSDVKEPGSQEEIINHVEHPAAAIFLISLSVFLIGALSRSCCLLANVVCLISDFARYLVYDTINNGYIDSVFCVRGRYFAI